MAEFRPAEGDQAEFLDELVAAGYLVRTGVDGVYGRGGPMEGVIGAFDSRVSRAAAAEDTQPLSFPPVIARHAFETSGYLKSFPHLAGSVFTFEGTEQEAGEQNQRAMGHEDWSEHQHMSDLVLAPAACYPVYPAVAARGPLPDGGVTVDTGPAYVFRNEPSGDPARLQMFRMRELVRIGEPETVTAWRDAWRDRALELLRSVGLDADFDVAADPFFGRGGRMLAASQREQALKFEILAPIAGPEPTAVASFNYHEDHFARTYGLEMASGGPAHTACLGFGLERVAMALLRVHGLDTTGWPGEVRELLWPA
jgi:seryl-tRNA synthetase